MDRRELSELIDREDPGYAVIAKHITDAAHPIEILPPTQHQAEENLLALQVTTRSLLGAIAYETGGILVDHGWLRLLGSGSERLPRSILSWNRLAGDPQDHRQPGALLIADDVVGGYFAVNGGSLPAKLGNVCYLAPDTCEWEDLDCGHSLWMEWVILGNLSQFYENIRWDSWEKDVLSCDSDHGFHIYPPMWSEDESVESRSRKIVPNEELWNIHTQEYPRQLGLLGNDNSTAN